VLANTRAWCFKMVVFKLVLNERHYLFKKGEERNDMNRQPKVSLNMLFSKVQKNVCQVHYGFSCIYSMVR